MFSLPTLINTRTDLCKQCRHYKAKTHACGYLIEKTAKKGYLNHQLGVGNMLSRCPHPNRYWLSIPRMHVYLLDKLYRLPDEERHKINKSGITNPFNLHTYLYPKLIGVKRSQLIEDLENIAKIPNDYAYLANEDVDYRTGELVER